MAVKKCSEKLSPYQKSIFGLRMWSQILCILVAACLFEAANADTQISCSNVRSTFEKKGMLSAVDIQMQPNSDMDGICLNKGCCGAGARSRLSGQVRTQLEGALRSELTKLGDMLANRATRFDEFFRKLLKLSREEFHSMFKRTYGMIYEQHSYVFEQLFEQLERYYARGDTNFSVMMDGFFAILYEKMFTVLNSQYQFDEKYLKCVNENMRDIQPFEDVPNKLTMQLKRAVVATRTFHKALRAGAEVVRNMIDAGVTAECVSSWTRLQYCGLCGDLQPPACSRYCHNVMRGCLPAHANIGEAWDAYVEAVDKVADRLLGPFNIAMVVEPIDIKISEAIMSFQEHNQEISQKIFSGCGKPVLGGMASAGPFSPSDKARRSVRSIPDFDWGAKAADVDDFEIEGSLENFNSDPLLTQIKFPFNITKVVAEMDKQSELREKFLEYMRGNIPLEAYEREKKLREADTAPAGASGMDIDIKSYDFYGKKEPTKSTLNNEDIHGFKKAVAEMEKQAALSKKLLEYMNGNVPLEAYEHERMKRDADPAPAGASGMDIDFKSYDFDGKKGPKKKKPMVKNEDSHGSEWGGPALEKLVRETRQRMRNSKHYWSQLPALLCTPTSVPTSPCFNGSAIGSYTLTAAGEGTAGQASNPEVRGATNPEAVSTAQAQSDTLRMLTAKLKDAYNGQEVQWTDDTDRDMHLTSRVSLDYGDEMDSGSGSGDYNSGNDGLPDDDEDNDGVEGSGDSFEQPTEIPTPSTEAPFVPNIVDTPGTNNVFTRTRVGDEPDDTIQPDLPEPDDASQDTSAREQPVASSAERPSLHKALFTYALPVVCAWFGTIVTDLF